MITRRLENKKTPPCLKTYFNSFIWKNSGFHMIARKVNFFKFNRLTLLANIFSLQFTEISECQPSSSYRASKSRFFPYIHCKFSRVCPTTKMTSVTVKPSIKIMQICPRVPARTTVLAFTIDLITLCRNKRLASNLSLSVRLEVQTQRFLFSLWQRPKTNNFVSES